MITRKMWNGKDSVRNTSDDRKGDPDPTSNVNKAKSPTPDSERKEDDPDPASSTSLRIANERKMIQTVQAVLTESSTNLNHEGMLFKLLTLVIGVVSAIGAYTIFYAKPVEKYWALKKLKKMSIKFEEPIDFVPRSKLEEVIRSKLRGNRTVIVAGTRGVGKSTLVKSCFKGETTVLSSGGVPISKEDVFQGLLEQLSMTVDKIAAASTIKLILTMAKRNNYKKPTIIVEVNGSWESSDLRDFLISLKCMGADEELASFIVVISAELSSYNININYKDLRCDIVYVPEASEEEAKKFFINRFSAMKDTSGENLFRDNEVDDMVKFALANVDRRFLSFQYLIPHEQRYSSIQDVKNTIRLNYMWELEAYQLIFQKIFEGLKIDNQRSEGFKLLQDLSEKEIKIADINKVYGIEMYNLFDLNHKWEPHAFTIDIVKKTIKISSDMMLIVLKEKLAALPK